jgi:hypothetical protein
MGLSLLLPVASFARATAGPGARLLGAGTTGLVVGAVALGTAAVALAVLARGASSRPEIAGPAGLLLSAVAVAGLALPVPAAAAAVLGLTIGLGIGLFTVHIGPLNLDRTPASHVARVQAVLVLAHAVPLLLTVTVLVRPRTS